MSECNHKWNREPFAGSLKCTKCGHVEFDVAGECLSLQERAEKAEITGKAWYEKYIEFFEDYGEPKDIVELLNKTKKERDELKAEVERLKNQLANIMEVTDWKSFEQWKTEKGT